MNNSQQVMREWANRLNAFGAAGEACFFLVDFEQARPQVWCKLEEQTGAPAFSFPNRQDYTTPPPGRPEATISPTHISTKDFRRAFDTVQTGLQRGDSFLTNLTFPVPVNLNCSLDDIYQQSEARYRILWPGHFVCFSPETFVTIDTAGYIESRPMKGTALDTDAARHDLLTSRKEIAEHATIVDLIRNDLSQVAKRVRVTDYRYFHEIASSRGLVQTSSKIGGQLPDDWKSRLGDLLADLLPAGSISGAPKPATLDLIRRAEGQQRGFYCGIGGYFDGKTVDTCVLIRFIEERADGSHHFRSGGGITARSKWRDEYEELKAKVRIPLAISGFSLH
jgi:para-aminobenzoate synthetase component 1